MTHRSGRAVLLAKELWVPLSIGKILGVLLAALLTGGTSASASDLVGKVTNGTTKKPSAGDEVVLLTLSNGAMNEGARAKTDEAGRFRFTGIGPPRPRLVRVDHQGVAYEKKAAPDVTSIEIQVYDAADKLDGVSAIMDVQRFEAMGDTLEVKQLVTMHNSSKPPRTLMNDHPFSIQLPPEAQLLSGLVQFGDGKTLKGKPAPGESKDEYYFRFPLRPGDTRFAVVYRLPYNGNAVIEPRVRNVQERFVVMLPKSMRFEPQAEGIFKAMPDVSPDNVQGTAPVTPGQMLAFRISGTGTLGELQDRQRPSRSDNEQSVTQVGPRFYKSSGTSRLDALILGGLGGVLLVFSAVWVAKRKLATPQAVECVVPHSHRRTGQREGQRKRHARVSQQYSH